MNVSESRLHAATQSNNLFLIMS